MGDREPHAADDGNNSLMKSITYVKPDAARSARVFGCTIEQAKALFAKNAEGMREIADKVDALPAGRKYRGYSSKDLARLRTSEADYREASK